MDLMFLLCAPSFLSIQPKPMPNYIEAHHYNIFLLVLLLVLEFLLDFDALAIVGFYSDR